MDDRILALCELSNDMLFHKIPPHRLAYYVDRSLAEGRQAAAEFAGNDLEALYRQKKISITYLDDSKEAFGVAYRGQITLAKDNCSLALFRSSIRALADNSANGEFPALSYEQAKDIHLAHEFFHFLEFQSGRFVSEMLDPVTTFQVFGFRRKAHINRCSEAAAHAFAKTLLNIPVLPNYYDYLYLMNTGAMNHEALIDRQVKYKEFLDSAETRPSCPI